MSKQTSFFIIDLNSNKKNNNKDNEGTWTNINNDDDTESA